MSSFGVLIGVKFETTLSPEWLTKTIKDKMRTEFYIVEDASQRDMSQNKNITKVMNVIIQTL